MSYVALASLFISIVPLAIWLAYMEFVSYGGGLLSSYVDEMSQGFWIPGLSNLFGIFALVGGLGAISGIVWGIIAGVPANKAMQTDQQTATRFADR